jgi:hypothetical protein
MTGRIARMNTAAVFVTLLFWTWLWGVWGMLLSCPIDGDRQGGGRERGATAAGG